MLSWEKFPWTCHWPKLLVPPTTYFPTLTTFNFFNIYINKYVYQYIYIHYIFIYLYMYIYFGQSEFRTHDLVLTVHIHHRLSYLADNEECILQWCFLASLQFIARSIAVDEFESHLQLTFCISSSSNLAQS